MIDKNHQDALVRSNEELKRSNTQLHAQVQHYKSENERVLAAIEDGIRGVVQTYDKHIEKAIKYLDVQGILERMTDEQVADFIRCFPTKLRSKE